MRLPICVVAFSVLAGFVLIGCEPTGPTEEKGALPPPITGELAKAKDIAAQQGVEAMWPEQQFSATGPINPSLYVDYQGKRIYFATKGEKETFEKQPEKGYKDMQQLVGVRRK